MPELIHPDHYKKREPYWDRRYLFLFLTLTSWEGKISSLFPVSSGPWHHPVRQKQGSQGRAYSRVIQHRHQHSYFQPLTLKITTKHFLVRPWTCIPDPQEQHSPDLLRDIGRDIPQCPIPTKCLLGLGNNQTTKACNCSDLHPLLEVIAKAHELYVRKPAMQQLSPVSPIWVSKALEQYWCAAHWVKNWKHITLI